MIALDTITNLTTAVVCVGRTSGTRPGELNIDPLTQIIEMPDIQQNPDGIVLSSMRNQLVATISPTRLQFQDRSQEQPARPDFPNRIVRVVDVFRKSVDLTLTAVGIVFEVHAGSDNATLPSQELQSFVKDDVFVGTRYDLMGASMRVWYTHGGRQYDLRVEPIGNQYEGREYFVRLHTHIPLSPPSNMSEEWLSEALRKEHNDLRSVLTRINRQAGRTTR